MSMNPYINMGYGYELDVNDTKVINRLIELFPKESDLYRDESGDIDEMTGFLYEVSENSRRKYRDLSFIVVSDDDIEPTLLIIDAKSQHELYDKYSSNDSGVVRPNALYTNNTEELAAFALDFGISADPEILIWTYWG